MRRLVVLIAFVLALTGSRSLAAQEDAATDPALGATVSYIGPEGDELATVTVTDLVDPFSDYDPNFPPERGNHYVLLTLTIENTGQRPLSVDPGAVVLQDSEGFLFSSSIISRGGDAEDTSIQFQELPAGDSIEGDIAFSVFNNVELIRVLYRPESDRLLVLADLRLSGEATDEPAEEPTAEATDTEEPTTPPDDATTEPTDSDDPAPPVDEATAEAANTDAPAPPPAETPAAAADAAVCEGIEAWLTDTRSRVERAVAIDEEITALGDPPGTDDWDTIRGFAAEFAVFAKQQREAAIPTVAATDNETLVQTFTAAARALADLAAGIETNDPVAVSTNLSVYRASALFLLVAPALLDQHAQDCGA